MNILFDNGLPRELNAQVLFLLLWYFIGYQKAQVVKRDHTFIYLIIYSTICYTKHTHGLS